MPARQDPHVDFPGSYWSSQMFTLVGALFGVIIGVIALVAALLFFLFGHSATAYIFLGFSVGTFAMIYLLSRRKASEYDEQVLTTYPNSRPKTSIVSPRGVNDPSRQFLCGFNKNGERIYQIRQNGKVGIGLVADLPHHKIRETILLIVNHATPVEWRESINKYWWHVPIDKDATAVLIEGTAGPDVPRPDFYYRIFICLRYSCLHDKNEVSHYPSPLGTVFEQPFNRYMVPIWWPEAFDRASVVVSGASDGIYPELAGFLARYPNAQVRMYQPEMKKSKVRYLQLEYGPISVY